MILEKTVIFITILISYFIQTSVDFFRLGSINADFLLILTIYFSYYRGPFAGLWVGFLGGLLQDINLGGMVETGAVATSYYIGTHALPKTLIGYFTGRITKNFHGDGRIVLFGLILVSNLIKDIILMFVIGLFHVNVSPRAIATIIIPESFYTAIVALVWFRILRWILPIGEVKT